jgi:hypothetical protein
MAGWMEPVSLAPSTVAAPTKGTTAANRPDSGEPSEVKTLRQHKWHELSDLPVVVA